MWLNAFDFDPAFWLRAQAAYLALAAELVEAHELRGLRRLDAQAAARQGANGRAMDTHPGADCGHSPGLCQCALRFRRVG